MKKMAALLLAFSVPVWAQTTTAQSHHKKGSHRTRLRGVITTGTFKGPTPWYDVTDPAWGAKCDGSTDDSKALQTVLAAAGDDIHGGTVYIPVSISGGCTFGTPLVMDNFTNVKVVSGTYGAWPGVAGTRFNLIYTGTTSPAISARNCFGCTFDGIYLAATNPGLTGTLVSFDAVAGGNGQTANSKVLNSVFSGPSGSNTVDVLLSLDNVINFTVDNVSFNNAQVAIKGVGTSGSSQTVSLSHASFGSAGACSISVADIQNPGLNWTVDHGSDFEIGNCSPGVQVIGITGGYAGPTGGTFTSNFVGDQALSPPASNPTSTWFTIPATVAGGWNFIGNQIAPASSNATLFAVGNNASLSVIGNVLCSPGTIMSTFLSLGTGDVVNSMGNCIASSTIGTFMSGSPGAGSLIMDASGTFNTGGTFQFKDSSGVRMSWVAGNNNLFLGNMGGATVFGPRGNLILNNGTGVVSTYDGLTTAGLGLPPILGTPLNLTEQKDNLDATMIYRTAASGAGSAGMYRVCIVLWPTATGNTTALQANVITPSGAGTVTTAVGSALNTTALTNGGGGCQTVHVAASSEIQVSTTGYKTAGTYGIQATVEQLF